MKNQNEAVKETVESNQKTAIVTGSSSGIGYATVLHLAKAGYFTLATMRNPANGIDLIKAAENENLPIQVEQLDVTDLDSIRDFMTRLRRLAGRIDILVNNAGYVRLKNCL